MKNMVEMLMSVHFLYLYILWEKNLHFHISDSQLNVFLLPSPGPCSPNPCKNDGTCEVIVNSRRGDTFNEYVCKCQPGFEGAHCQISKYCNSYFRFTTSLLGKCVIM